QVRRDLSALPRPAAMQSTESATLPVGWVLLACECVMSPLCTSSPRRFRSPLVSRPSVPPAVKCHSTLSMSPFALVTTHGLVSPVLGSPVFCLLPQHSPPSTMFVDVSSLPVCELLLCF